MDFFYKLQSIEKERKNTSGFFVQKLGLEIVLDLYLVYTFSCLLVDVVDDNWNIHLFFSYEQQSS